MNALYTDPIFSQESRPVRVPGRAASGLSSHSELGESRSKNFAATPLLVPGAALSGRSASHLLQDTELGHEDTRILVVESHVASRRELSDLLNSRGYEVIESGTGEEVLSLADSLRPDLILIAATPGESDCFEICRQIKAMESLTEVPVIFLVDDAETWNATAGFLAGASDFIAKPIREREAISRIEKHLKVCRLLRSRSEQIDELDSLNQAKDRVLRMTSHELRNTMSNITDLAEMITTEEFGSLTDEQKKALGWITSAAEGVREMVNDLQAIVSIDSERDEARFSSQKISEVAQTTVRLAQGTAAKKQLSLSLNIKTEPPPSAFDRNQIRRVIENFISNAIKFSSSGGSVRVLVDSTEEQARIEVHDEGPGVPENEQTRLFNEFCFTSARPTAGETSTGLGLYICRQIVAQHGGEIGMYNRPEGGACFFFSLPLKQST